jgi:dynein heavy chain
MYGGRVIDDYDQRIVNTFMKQYFGEFIVDIFQTFYLYHDDKVQYKLIAVDTKEEFLSNNNIYSRFIYFKIEITIDAIEELPSTSGPEVLGLHMNAEMGYFTKASRDIWNNLLKLQPQTGKSTNISWDN